MFLTTDGLSAIKKGKSNLRSKSRDKDQDGRGMLMFWTCQKPFNRLSLFQESLYNIFSFMPFSDRFGFLSEVRGMSG